MTFRLVYHSNVDFGRGKVSILARIGTALIGYRAGDTVDWQTPSGFRRLQIREALCQPEAAGDCHFEDDATPVRGSRA